MARGNGRIGVPELLVGVPFPPSVIEAIRFAVPPQHLQMLMYTGRTLDAVQALEHGLVDEIVDAGDLEERATAAAREMAALPPAAFALAKRQLRDHAVSKAKHYANELDAQIAEMWADPATHERIRAYLAKTVKK
jgi:enoyl-CoA hydratase